MRDDVRDLLAEHVPGATPRRSQTPQNAALGRHKYTLPLQPEDYRARFEIAAERGLEMICANPDRVVQRGDTLIYCGGALADLYEEMGGKVLMAGKPYSPIYDLALHEAGDVDPKRVLCIGDGVITDVKGAADHNLDCLFMARGIHGDSAMKNGKLDASAVEALLAEEDLGARYAMSDLVW